MREWRDDNLTDDVASQFSLAVRAIDKDVFVGKKFSVNIEHVLAWPNRRRFLPIVTDGVASSYGSHFEDWDTAYDDGVYRLTRLEEHC